MARKSARTRWEPPAMPWIAEAFAASERAQQASIDALPAEFAEHTTHPSRPYRQRFAQKVGDAELFWLSRTAASVAADLAARGIPAITFHELIETSDLPPSGLMLWPKSLAPLPWTNHRVHDPHAEAMVATWDGLAWMYDSEEFSTYLLSRVMEQRSAGVLSDARPSWSPGQVVRFESQPLDTAPGYGGTLVEVREPLDEFADVAPSVSQIVTALLAVIGQERVITSRTMQSARPANSTKSSSEESPRVTLLDVLKPGHSGGATGRSAEADRALRRWFVRGHWRRQPYGPERRLRKLIYVDLHTAGHADAPEPTGTPPPRVKAIYGSKLNPLAGRAGSRDTEGH